MLSLGKFPAQIQYNTLLHNPIPQNSHFTSKTHFPFSCRLNFHGKMQNGLCCKALKTKKKGDFNLSEMDGSDEVEDDFDDEFLDGEDDGEFEKDDEGEDFIPLKNMKQWLKNRPRGFGEGKEYDTSLEDKLMEEIEQSRKAQLANLNKLKNNPVQVQPNSKKETSKQDKGTAQMEDGFRVRLVNLPKKKNIHRDLQLAFKEVRGILNILPLVSGNEKTRDPVCRGLAFVDFKYQDEAQRFVQNFSGASISFGKVQKQIKCEMMDSKLPKPKLKPAHTQSIKDQSNSTPQQAVLNLDEDSDSDVESDGPQLDSQDESEDDEDERDNDVEMKKETSTPSVSNLAEEVKVGKQSDLKSSVSKNARNGKMKETKAAPKKKKEKNSKLKIPGSANRLKIREKAMLTDVFSKYGATANSTVKEQSR